MPRIIVRDAEGFEHSFELEGPVITIGRRSRCDIVVPDPRVSKQHGRIVRRDDGWWYEDTNSSNGSFYEGQRIERHRLRAGDRIRIGHSELRFEETDSERLEQSVRFLAEPELTAKIQESVEIKDARSLAPEAEVVDLGALRVDYEKMRLGLALLQRLHPKKRLDAMLAQAAAALRELFDADRCVVLIDDPESPAQLRPAAIAARDGVDPSTEISRAVLREVQHTHQAVLLTDAIQDARFADSASLMMSGMRSVLCAPIVHEGSILGAIHLDSRRGAAAFSRRDLQILAGIAPYLAIAIANARLIERIERETRLKAQLERLLSPSVAAQVAAGKLRLDEAGERRTLTILFADIRGFTELTRSMAPEETVQLLNAYFERVVELVFRFGGTLDKYIGDEVMAFFGAPVPLAHAADRAVACALEVQAEMRRWGAERQKQGLTPIRVGIGIASGDVVVGSIGASRTRQYTCIGAAANVAARLTQLAPAGEVLLDEATRKAMQGEIACAPFELEGPIKGLGEAIRIWRALPLSADEQSTEGN